jgi:hypothetical protein
MPLEPTSEVFPEHYDYQPFHWQLSAAVLNDTVSSSGRIDDFEGQPIYSTQCEDGSLLYSAYPKHHHRGSSWSKEVDSSLLNADIKRDDSKVGSRSLSRSMSDQPYCTAKADLRVNEAEASKQTLLLESSHVTTVENHNDQGSPKTAEKKTRKHRGSGRRNRRKAGLGKQ